MNKKYKKRTTDLQVLHGSDALQATKVTSQFDVACGMENVWF